VDTPVNNAYAEPPFDDFVNVELDDIRTSFETTVFAALRLTRLFSPALASTKGVDRDDQLNRPLRTGSPPMKLPPFVVKSVPSVEHRILEDAPHGRACDVLIRGKLLMSRTQGPLRLVCERGATDGAGTA
jgi:NAD(P)-dependent dehydrogenase (short-subunit alcohol dehydrogenase family)